MHPHGVEDLGSELDDARGESLTLTGDLHEAFHTAGFQKRSEFRQRKNDGKIENKINAVQSASFSFYLLSHLENSGCFLITSLSVASTAAMVSSEVP